MWLFVGLGVLVWCFLHALVSWFGVLQCVQYTLSLLHSCDLDVHIWSMWDCFFCLMSFASCCESCYDQRVWMYMSGSLCMWVHLSCCCISMVCCDLLHRLCWSQTDPLGQILLLGLLSHSLGVCTDHWFDLVCGAVLLFLIVSNWHAGTHCEEVEVRPICLSR